MKNKNNLSIAEILKIESDNTHEFKSYLIKTVNNLLLKPIKDFSVEDFRIMLGQNMYPEILAQHAISILKNNILAEGDFYQGDLLKALISLDIKYWRENTEQLKTIHNLINKHLDILKENEIDVNAFIKNTSDLSYGQ